MSQTKQTLTISIATLLRPLVKLLLGQGIAFEAVSEQLKLLYVDVAEKEFGLEGKKQTTSRISTITGLSRKEVSKAKAMDGFDLSSMTQQYNRAARVIGGWSRDKDFHDSKGKPLLLNVEGDKNSFTELVKRHSGDVPMRAIKDELIRVGAIEVVGRNKIKLIQKAYVPQKNIDEKIKILGTDVSDLIKTIYHNIYNENEAALFQRKVSYDSIPIKSLNLIKDQIAERSQKCLEDLDKLMVAHDSDTNKELDEVGHCRAGLGIYYFEERTNDS